MKIRLQKFQQGGPMGAPAPAPEQGGGDPMQQLLMMAQQALESQDCQAAMAVCDALMQLASGGAQAGPEGGAPAPEAAPAGPEAGEPVYRAGGRLVRRVAR